MSRHIDDIIEMQGVPVQLEYIFHSHQPPDETGIQPILIVPFPIQKGIWKIIS
jgi:hypothetical protein